MRRLILLGLLLNLLVVCNPLIAEIRTLLKDLPLLWGKSNGERRIAMLGGMLDAVEDHEFITRCTSEIPPDANVLVVSNSMANVYILNYYLYPRKTGVDKGMLGKSYWVVHYNNPKALGMNRIEGPGGDGADD